MKQDFQTAIAEKCKYLEQCGRFSEEKNAYQHGMSTVYRHSILVAAVSLSIADKLGLPVNRDNLIRGHCFTTIFSMIGMRKTVPTVSMDSAILRLH